MSNVFKNALEMRAVLPTDRSFTLVGGCFDLIHVGHLHLLEYAASLGNLLVVAVLSDRYIKHSKYRYGPVIEENYRVKMVASIGLVDYVYMSDMSSSSPETLSVLKPTNIVFCTDSIGTEKMDLRMKNISQFSPLTEVLFLDRYSDSEVSTGKIIRKIKDMKM